MINCADCGIIERMLSSRSKAICYLSVTNDLPSNVPLFFCLESEKNYSALNSTNKRSCFITYYKPQMPSILLFWYYIIFNFGKEKGKGKRRNKKKSNFFFCLIMVQCKLLSHAWSSWKIAIVNKTASQNYLFKENQKTINSVCLRIIAYSGL